MKSILKQVEFNRLDSNSQTLVLWTVILLNFFIGLVSCNSKETTELKAASVEVVPFPNKILKRGGTISVSNNIWVVANVSDSLSSALATYLVNRLSEVTGQEARITDLFSTRKHAQSISLELDYNATATAYEAYTLDITSPQIKIKSKSAQGVFYGIQSLMQILKAGANDMEYELPKIVIKDSPRYLIRGVLISRTQLNNISDKRFLYRLAVMKINSLFLIDDETQTKKLMREAEENYIKICSADNLPDDITLLDYGRTAEEREKIYTEPNIDTRASGVVLDLTTTALEDLEVKLSVLAELSWTFQSNHNFLRLNKLSEKILELN